MNKKQNQITITPEVLLEKIKAMGAVTPGTLDAIKEGRINQKVIVALIRFCREVPNRKDFYLQDTAVKGLALRVRSNGNLRWYLSYREKSGRKTQHRFNLGDATMLPREDAMTMAKERLKLLEKGLDPFEDRKVEPPATLAEFWSNHYLPWVKGQKRWKSRTEAENLRRWNLQIAPVLGSKAMESITRRDIENLVAKVGGKGSKTSNANFTLRLVKAIFNAAIEREFIQSSPAKMVKPYKEQSTERFLTSEETRAIFDAIDLEESLFAGPSKPRTGEAQKGRGGKGLKESESRGISPHAASLFRLLMFTGARLREIMDARWEWVDLVRGTLSLPDSKTGAKVIHLNLAAREELTKRMNADGASGFIIKGRIEGQPMINATKPWKRVLDRAKVADVRIHDLRHNLASQAIMAGIPLAEVGKLLGHKNSRTTERYAHIAETAAQEAMERVGQRISESARKPEIIQIDCTNPIDDHATGAKRATGKG